MSIVRSPRTSSCEGSAKGKARDPGGFVPGLEGPKVDEGLAGGLFDRGGRIVERVLVGRSNVDEADEPELGVSFGELAFARLDVGDAVAFS